MREGKKPPYSIHGRTWKVLYAKRSKLLQYTVLYNGHSRSLGPHKVTLPYRPRTTKDLGKVDQLIHCLPSVCLVPE